MRRPYEQRRVLRWLERAWAKLEQGLNALTGPRFNPLYHLGTLALFLLGVLLFTGIYLTVFYRPGADRAYETVAGMSATWLGLIMRSLHRYAADALLIVVVLHAWKMLISDRFWGSRWVAWVTGWGLLGLIWVIGVMGYWLVWDRQAQWITEFGARVLGGATAYLFFGPQLAARSFAFFVIVLFLHIFLSVLILLGFLLHILRLSRPRWLSPRWLMVESALALMVLSLLRPAPLLPKADFSYLVGNIPIDWLYLAFLPLSTRWGNVIFWGVAFGLFLVAAALPWIWPGESAGPVRVTEHLCTGCALCALKCPYEAIEIVPRSDETGFKALAVVKPNLCVGCGLCIGTCGAVGIDMRTVPTSALLQRLEEALAQVPSGDQRPILAVTCQRHAALGTLPWHEGVPVAPDIVSTEIPVAGAPVPLVVADFPCAGMVNPEWLRPWVRESGRVQGIVFVTCPADDCAYREGPHWLAQNLKYRLALLRGPLYWLEAVPGDRKAFVTLVERLVRDPASVGMRAADVIQRLLAPVHTTWRFAWRPLVAGLALMFVLTSAAFLVEQPAQNVTVNSGVVRMVMAHPGKVKAVSGALSPEMAARLPPGVSPEQVLGGERYPVRLRILVDGEVRAERTFTASGLRHEGLTYGLAEIGLSAGPHTVRVLMMDDGETWRVVFDGEVTVPDGRVVTLVYDEERGVFRVYRPAPS